MPHRRGSTFERGRSSSRRQTGWSAGPATGSTPGSVQAITAAGTTLAILGSAPTVDDLTLVRLRGMLTLSLSAAATALDGFVGAFGIANVGSEAFATGAAALPDPQDDQGDERWLYHTFFQLTSLQTTQALIGSDNMATLRVPVDSKAMRKTPGGSTLVAIIGVEEVGAATLQWMFNCRVLDKLP